MQRYLSSISLSSRVCKMLEKLYQDIPCFHSLCDLIESFRISSRTVQSKDYLGMQGSELLFTSDGHKIST
jgi:hypothetical protein